ncbi:radical SAM protein [Clostridium sp. Marseille-QA1073]
MKYKKSKYNIEIDNLDNEKVILFNTFSGALATMKNEEYNIYNNIEDVDIDNEKNLDIINLMYNNGYIVEDEIDEYKRLELETKFVRYSNKGALHITIAPTMNCNMECPYCFEQKDAKRMDKDIETKIIKYIKNYLSRNQEINALTVAWYGGEPLLEKETIKRMSKEIIEFTKENNIDYTSKIITNGVLLDYDTARMLKEECKISFAQITLDGVYETNNKTRILKNRDDSFKIITNNIEKAKDILDITVRMNISKENVEDSKKLTEFFVDKNWQEKVNLYFSPVTSNTDVNKNISNKCFTMNEFNENFLEFESHLVTNGIRENVTYPENFFGCSAIGVHGLVIDPEGNFCKCWHRINIPEYYIGNIKEGININKEYIEWLTLETPKKCTECKIYPICKSGCPHDRLNNNNIPICEYSMNQLIDQIKTFYKNLDKEYA